MIKPTCDRYKEDKVQRKLASDYSFLDRGN